MSEKSLHQKFRSRLMKWYRANRREMPWRETRDPYRIWVSEIMLQQTQVKTVIPYYQRWMKSFPTAQALAEAPEERVLKHWEGLGYYSRARNLHRGARMIVREHKGAVPDTLDAILKIPGVGRYTAGAVLSIAYGVRAPVLDGNVRRVLSRWFCVEGAGTELDRVLWDLAASLLPRKDSGDFNQALMELGATVCLPRNPSCLVCPVRTLCRAALENRQGEFPRPKPKTPTKKIEVSAAVIWRRGKVFIQQRPKAGLMGGLWEFPGGKRERGESPEECLVREIREELGVVVEPARKLMTVKHAYTQFRVTLHVFECHLPAGRISAQQCEQWTWAAPSELPGFAYPAANVRIVEHLTGYKISK